MKIILAIPVLLLGVAVVAAGLSSEPLSSDKEVYEENSYAFDKRYASRIPTEKLVKSPSWNRQSDSPPFPPGRAIRLANGLKDKLVRDSKRYKWHLMSVTLDRLHPFVWDDEKKMGDKWWWSIRYEAHVREGGETGEPDHLVIIVLMDGTVIVPKVTDEEKG
jgi:hypothetical protein